MNALTQFIIEVAAFLVLAILLAAGLRSYLKKKAAAKQTTEPSQASASTLSSTRRDFLRLGVGGAALTLLAILSARSAYSALNDSEQSQNNNETAWTSLLTQWPTSPSPLFSTGTKTNVTVSGSPETVTLSLLTGNATFSSYLATLWASPVQASSDDATAATFIPATSTTPTAGASGYVTPTSWSTPSQAQGLHVAGQTPGNCAYITPGTGGTPGNTLALKYDTATYAPTIPSGSKITNVTLNAWAWGAPATNTITYVGASSGAVAYAKSGTTFSCTMPASVANNDILICLIATLTTTAPTVSGGGVTWNQIDTGGTANGTTMYTHVYWARVSGAVSSATITHTNNTNTVAEIYAYRGCTQTGTPYTTYSAPQVNTTSSRNCTFVTPWTYVANDMVVLLTGAAARVTFTSWSTSPLTMANEVDGPNQAGYPSIFKGNSLPASGGTMTGGYLYANATTRSNTYAFQLIPQTEYPTLRLEYSINDGSGFTSWIDYLTTGTNAATTLDITARNTYWVSSTLTHVQVRASTFVSFTTPIAGGTAYLDAVEIVVTAKSAADYTETYYTPAYSSNPPPDANCYVTQVQVYYKAWADYREQLQIDYTNDGSTWNNILPATALTATTYAGATTALAGTVNPSLSQLGSTFKIKVTWLPNTYNNSCGTIYLGYLYIAVTYRTSSGNIVCTYDNGAGNTQTIWNALAATAAVPSGTTLGFQFASSTTGTPPDFSNMVTYPIYYYPASVPVNDLSLLPAAGRYFHWKGNLAKTDTTNSTPIVSNVRVYHYP